MTRVRTMSRPHRNAPVWAWIIRLIGGPVLVLIGAAMFADELGYELPDRWVALVLLLPAGVALAGSIRHASRQGRWNTHLLARAIAAILFGAIGVLLYLRTGTGLLLPTLIMALGVGAILRALFAKH